MELNFLCARPSVRYYKMESIFTSFTHIRASLHLDELGTVWEGALILCAKGAFLLVQ